MTESGARQANRRNFEQGIGWKLSRIIELLEELIRLSLEALPSLDAENGEGEDG